MAAAPIRVTPPKTLPADFAGFDDAGPPSTLPADFAGFDDVAASEPKRAPGANPARNKRQAFRERGLTPEQVKARSEAVTGLVKSYPGAEQLWEGTRQLATPGQRKEGLHNVIAGGGKAAAIPFLAPAMVAAPVATITALGAGMAASPVAEFGAKVAGAEDDTAALVGDAAGIAAGGAAGMIPRVGAAARAAAFGAFEHAPIVGKKGVVGGWLKGIWDNAKAAYDTAGEPKAQPLAGPKPAPVTAPGGGSAADLDATARNLGARDFAELEQANPALAERLRVAVQPKPAPVESTIPGSNGMPAPRRPVPDTPKPAPTPVGGSQSVPKAAPLESTSPVGAQPNGRPRTVRDLLDQEMAARTPATPVESAQNAGITPRSEADISRAAAAELVKRGVTPDHLLAMTDAERAQALGADAHRFGDIVREVRSQVSGGKMDAARGSKDEAMARFFNAKGITPDQVAAMDEGTLATHIKSAGFRAPGSGSLSRTHAQVQHDIVEAMRRNGGGASSANPQSNPAPTPTPSPGPAVAEPANNISAESKPLSQAVENTTQESAQKRSPEGITAVVRTPKQTRATVRYRISEADDLKTSFDPDYDTAIGHQPRDTSRIGSEQRLQQRMSDLDPEAMGPSSMAGDGAPITNQNHAITRNHGTEALKRLYRADSPRAQQYREWVQEQAGLAGMTPEQVAGMKAPVLHRELVGDWDTAKIKNFADEANMSSVARMSPTELAQQVAGRMTGGVMAKYDPTEAGIPNSEFVREIMKGLPPEEAAELQMRDGTLNKRGEEMIRNAIFAKAYRSTDALEALAEDPEPLVKSLTNGMLKAAPKNAMLQEAIAQGEAHPLGIGEEVGNAVEIIQNLRQNKKTVEDWLNQGDLLGRDPVVHSMVDILAGEARRPNVIRDTLNNYVELVRALGTPKQAGIFGEAELPTKLDLLEEAYGRAKSEAAAAAAKRKGKSEGEELFGSQSGNTPSGP